MSKLNEDSTLEEIENFLLSHMEEADERQSKINPSLTKQQVWDINMGAVMTGDITRVRTIMIKNITREFGSCY